MMAQVYRCYNREGELLYVGCSRNVEERIKVHRAKSAWAVALHSYEADDPLPVDEAFETEKVAIQLEGPRFNYTGRGNDLDAPAARARFIQAMNDADPKAKPIKGSQVYFNWKRKGFAGLKLDPLPGGEK